MAEIELAALVDRLDDDEIKTLAALLDKANVNYDVSHDYPRRTIAARLSEEAMTEFLDKLDAHDVAAEIYLPVEFDTTIAAGDYRVSSTQTLLGALEELKEELDIEEYEDDEEGEEEEAEEEEDDVSEAHLITSQLRHIWHLLSEAAEESVDRNVPLQFGLHIP